MAVRCCPRTRSFPTRERFGSRCPILAPAPTQSRNATGWRQCCNDVIMLRASPVLVLMAARLSTAATPADYAEALRKDAAQDKPGAIVKLQAILAEDPT